MKRFSPRILREKRYAAGMRQERLAVESDLSVYSVVGYERGRWVPRADSLDALAHALGCPIDDLFENDNTGGT
jgi:transcriptional regulator with XRE-family HTH domain